MSPLDVLPTAVETYNEYRSPMATAAVVERGDDRFTVRFSGPFCRTCCRDDYFEDLVYEFAEHGVDPDRVRVVAYERTAPETFAVDYEVP